jgi:hypothetical protein
VFTVSSVDRSQGVKKISTMYLAQGFRACSRNPARSSAQSAVAQEQKAPNLRFETAEHARHPTKGTALAVPP